MNYFWKSHVKLESKNIWHKNQIFYLKISHQPHKILSKLIENIKDEILTNQIYSGTGKNIVGPKAKS